MMPLEMQKYHTMIDPFLAQRLKKGEPYNYNNYKGIPWIYRALDKKTPTTQAKETIKTESNFYNGKEILYPTVRMQNGKLKKMKSKEAFEEAIRLKDYIEFNNGAEADAFAKGLSDYIGRMRNEKFSATSDKYDYGTAKQLNYKKGEDGHMPTRDYKTGKILKGTKHKTFSKAINQDFKMGYQLMKAGNRYYTEKNRRQLRKNLNKAQNE